MQVGISIASSELDASQRLGWCLVFRRGRSNRWREHVDHPEFARRGAVESLLASHTIVTSGEDQERCRHRGIKPLPWYAMPLRIVPPWRARAHRMQIAVGFTGPSGSWPLPCDVASGWSGESAGARHLGQLGPIAFSSCRSYLGGWARPLSAGSV